MSTTILPGVTRPALRYFGAKFRLAPWIIQSFPSHTCYVEPFGGGGGILLRKSPSAFEVYNDLDGGIVNFFRVLRDQPEELLRAITLTPYSREEQRIAFEPSDDPLESARRLYVRSWQSHGGGRTQWRSGWRYQMTATRGKSILTDWNSVDSLWPLVMRLKEVQIECDDALRVIERFDRPDTLFYVDPPYVASTRSLRWRDKAYHCEIDDEYHRRLAGILRDIAGMAVVSGHPCALYDDLYQGWQMRQRTVPTDFSGTSVECLWLSPNTVARATQISLSLPEETE